MEVVGLDTGFFIQLLKGNTKALQVWEGVIGGEVKAITSALVLFELKRILHKIDEAQKWDDLREAIVKNCDVVVVDVNIAERSASVSYGTGLPAVDALIYTSVVDSDLFFTTDRSFDPLKGRSKPRIVFL